MSLNKHWTSASHEPQIWYGTAFSRHLVRIWNLRISYPNTDILLWDDDVSGAFRLIKYNPEIATAFSAILDKYLCVPVGQVFGGNTSAQNWEGIARAREHLAEHLSSPDSAHLIDKHHNILKLIQFSPPPTSSTRFVHATPDHVHNGVFDNNDVPVNTPHNTFVDDNTIADIPSRMKQAMAASAESLFRLMGHPEPTLRRSPLSMEKYYQAMCSFEKKQLGYLINTRTMSVTFSPEKFDSILSTLSNWHDQRRSYTLKEAATLAGSLEFFASVSTWIRFVTTSLKHSILIGLRQNSTIIRNDPQMTAYLQDSSLTANDQDSLLRKNFAFSKIMKKTWDCKQKYFISRTLRQEIKFLIHIFKNRHIFKIFAPISHIIPRHPDFIALGDACLDGAGGFSPTLKYWWFIPWPPQIRTQTLKYIHKKYKTAGNTILSINLLEYAAIILSFAAAIITHSDAQHPNPYPTIEILSDNKTAIAWTRKASSSSREGKNLSLLFTSLLHKTHLGLKSAYIPGDDNTIADRISRMQTTNKRISFSSLSQAYPTLTTCTRFHPSQELLSATWAALLSPQQFLLPQIKKLGHLAPASTTG